MKRIFICFIFILLLCGCSKEKESITTISINNTSVEYGTEIYLYDLITIKDGTITTKNYLIDTSKLDNVTISFKYKDSNRNDKIYKFDIAIVDTTAPKIFNSTKYYTVRGEEIDLVNKPLCGDNYDRNISCSIEGNYDINTVGEYDLKIIATDSSNNYAEENIKLIVLEEELEDNYETIPYYINDLINTHKNDNTMIGIDVSTWQDDIDWNKVKAAGVEFAMIRIGFGYYKDKLVIDNKFENNIKAAKEVGIKVGIYFYSYAKNTKEAKEQANWVIKTLNKEKLDLPIAFDWEIWDSFKEYNLNFVDLNNIAKAFMKEIENNGYEAMNYGSARYLNAIWELSNYKTWLAHYTNETDYPKEYYIWQLSSSGIVDGINGYVDLNILYKN